MDFSSALELLLEQVPAWKTALLLLGIGFIYYRLAKGRIRSVLDPLAYTLLLSACTGVLLTFLFAQELVSVEKLAFSVVTLVLFYGTFLFSDTSRRLPSKPRRAGNPSNVAPLTLAVLFACNTLLLGITYFFFGVPLFLESRLSLFIESGGFGVIGRLANGLEFVSIVLAFIAIRRHAPARKWGVLIIIQFVVSSILSGSKGSLLFGVFAWYLAGVYLDRSWRPQTPLPRGMVWFLVLVLLSPLLTLHVQSGGDAVSIASLFRLLAVRIAAEGDGYVYFFANDFIDTISRPDLLALVRPILVALRLTGADTAVTPGFEVMRELLGIDTAAGPNARLPIYLLYFYGFGGLALAPILGWALGAARNALLHAAQGPAFRFALLAAVYLNCTKLEVDPQITVNGLFNLALVFPILYLCQRLDRGLQILRAVEARNRMLARPAP